MILYRMTATFGKLEHETLTLEPGLNIFQAENEWGKSTWCAFLMAMLYGLDTRTKSTKNALADKDRYIPWSGSPMSGSMDICWRGRDITIERSTRGRVPLGEFRAFETKTGIAVPELTAANCGQLLLGVEQSVFRRAGFIRFSDLPVTQDDALRRRLHALVTTADENGDGEKLERNLRELKNKCRYNRTGWIPQTEQERSAIAQKLEEWISRDKQVQKLQSRLAEIEAWTEALKNHQQAMHYAASEADAGRIAQANLVWEKAKQKETELQTLCGKLPAQDQAERKVHQLREFQQLRNSLQMEMSILPEQPLQPEVPAPYGDIPLEKAWDMVSEDAQHYAALRIQKPGLLPLLAAVILGLLGAYLAFLGEYLYCGGAAAAAMVLMLIGINGIKQRRKKMHALVKKYGSDQPDQWRAELGAYAAQQKQYSIKLAEYKAVRGELDVRMEAMKTQQQSLCGAQSPEKVLDLWQTVLRRWEEYHTARREAQRAQTHLEDLQAMSKAVHRPAMADELTYTESETARLISDAVTEQQRLQNRLGQHQGRMEVLGDRQSLEKQLMAADQRLKKLEETYTAADLALETLAEAKRELQRRFAPRIAKRAQQWMEKLTAGRYRRLLWDEDFGLSAGTGEEDVLHSAMWRSDGTVDQLYLALRLAVAQELTPEAPLILDDALVRFDDNRLGAALEILTQMAREKQVLLFTCQSREIQIMKNKAEGV